MGSHLEKCGTFWKTGCFSGQIWPDWGYTTWADLAGLGSIGLSSAEVIDKKSLTSYIFTAGIITAGLLKVGVTHLFHILQPSAAFTGDFELSP